MDTVVISNLLFNSLGLVAVVLGAAVYACLPARRQPRRWVLAGADGATAARPSAPEAATPPQDPAVELPRAA